MCIVRGQSVIDSYFRLYSIVFSRICIPLHCVFAFRFIPDVSTMSYSSLKRIIIFVDILVFVSFCTNL